MQSDEQNGSDVEQALGAETLALLARARADVFWHIRNGIALRYTLYDGQVFYPIEGHSEGGTVTFTLPDQSHIRCRAVDIKSTDEVVWEAAPPEWRAAAACP